MYEITKSLMCIQMRSGVEIWKEKDEVEKLQEVLSAITKSTFVHFGEMTINTADIVGVFDSGTMESSTRRRNGDCNVNTGFGIIEMKSVKIVKLNLFLTKTYEPQRFNLSHGND